MKIDWQEFEDGGLDDEAMRQAKDELSRNPSAQKELKGLAAFRRSVRAAVMAEPVPEQALNGMLKQVCGRPSAPFWQKGLALASAAAVCVVLALVLLNQFGGGSDWAPPATAFVSTGDFERDFASATKQSPIYVPHLNLSGLAEYKGVHSCMSSVSFKLAFHGQDFTLTVAPKGQLDPNGEVFDAEGTELVRSGEAYCWTCPSSSYRLEGGSPEERAKFAAALTKQTGYERPKGSA